MIKSNKKTITTLVMCIISLLLIIGGSYAYWYKEIKTGSSGLEVYSTEMEFLESDSKIISIENAFPLIDEVGINQEESFDFQVKTKTKKDTAISYDLVLEKIGIKCSEIENPTQEEYPSCYDIIITDSNKEEFMQGLYWIYGAKSKDEKLYQAIIAHDNQAIYDFFIDKNYSEETAAKYLTELQDNNYEQRFYSWGVDFEYSFNENNSFYDRFLSDGEVKLYLTDYNDNVIVEPTKISDLREQNYLIYTKKNVHSEQNEAQQDKYKLKVWISEDVNPASWNENNSFKYDFKINVKTSVMHDVNVIVENGIIDDAATKKVAKNDSVSFNLLPNNSGDIGIVKCTNNQKATMENNVLTVKKINNDTTCTVKFMDSRTVLYEDGTLIINELAENISANKLSHGEEKAMYEPLSEEDSYSFDSISDIKWYNEKNLISHVEIGQEIMPYETDIWFYNLENMETGDFSNLNTTETTSMYAMFEYAGYNSTTFNLIGLSEWDTSQVTAMSAMFDGAGRNATEWSIGDLSEWDTSQAVWMGSMFSEAGASAENFNIGDLSGWDTSQAHSLDEMFARAGNSSETFNIGNIGTWDVGNVNSMYNMFSLAGENATEWYIGDLSEWDTSQVNSFLQMFDGAGKNATEFNIGNIGGWDISQVTNIESMFSHTAENATEWYIGDLSEWDTSQVNSFLQMFKFAGQNATEFNIGNIGGWDTSQVTDMTNMFECSGQNATEWYIGDLSSWDTSNVTSTNNMFYNAGHNATEFNIGNIGGWDTSQIIEMRGMFASAGTNSTEWNIGDLSSWDVSNVTNMGSMFELAGFEDRTFSIGDISGWDTSQVEQMGAMFYGTGYYAYYFSLDLSGWNVQNVIYYDGFNEYVEDKITPPVWVN